MARVRISTTVDEQLLLEAKRLRSNPSDSVLLEEALRSLVAQYRAAAIDASYAAYDEHPLDEPDAWGDLESFHRAASGS